MRNALLHWQPKTRLQASLATIFMTLAFAFCLLCMAAATAALPLSEQVNEGGYHALFNTF